MEAVGLKKIAAVAAGVPGTHKTRAVEYLVPDVLVAFIERDMRLPSGRDEEFARASAAFEEIFAEGRRAVFNCRYLSARIDGRAVGMYGVPDDRTGLSVYSSYTGESVPPYGGLAHVVDRASMFHKSLLPGVTVAVSGIEMDCSKCGSEDVTKRTLGVDRDETGRLRIFMLCMICGKTWGDVYESS